MRPQLNPAWRRVWRDAQTLQIGWSPHRAVVLTGVSAGLGRWLDRLDGTRDLAQLLADAATLGIDVCAAGRLIDDLRAIGAVRDIAEVPATVGRMPLAERDRLAPDLAALGLLHPDPLAVLGRRQQFSVRVYGGGRVGATVATVLAAAGVGTVHVDDPAPARLADCAPAGLSPAEVGRPRAAASHDRIHHVAPSARTGVTAPDLAVITDQCAASAKTTVSLLRDGIAHLFVSIHEDVAVIGPLVLPGRSACLRCLDLTRTDRDPHWPAIAAQLAYPNHLGQTSRPGPSGGAVPCDVVLAHLSAGLAAREALSCIDQTRPTTVNGTLELHEWRIRRRSWRPHPACGCTWS
jgi:hypothetical protein